MPELLTDEEIQRMAGPAPALPPPSAPLASRQKPTMAEAKQFGTKKRAEAAGADVLGNLLDDATLASLGVPVEEARFRPRSKMTELEQQAAGHAQATISGGGPGQITEGIDSAKRVGSSFKFDKQAVYNYLRESYGAKNVAPSRNPDSGEVTNFVIRDKDGKVKVFDPEGLDWGDPLDFARDAAEAGPGVAGGIIGGIASGGNPLAIAAGGAIGDAIGSAGTQAIGAALPGSEEHVSGTERAVSGAINVGSGIAIPAAGKALRWTGGKLRKAAGVLPSVLGGKAAIKGGLASGVASEFGDESLRSVSKKTAGSYLDETLRIQEEISKGSGEKLTYSLGEATGSPTALGAERMASQTPEIADKMALDRQRRLVAHAKYADSITDHLAADPTRLGNADVGEQAGAALTRLAKSRVDARSAAAGPLYEKATEMFDGQRIVPTDATRSAMAELVEANKFGPSKITGQIGASLKKIEGASAETGRLSVGDVQNLRALWGQAARGEVTIVEGLSVANQRRMARNVLNAIDSDLDAATKGIQGEAAEALRLANQTWAKHSQGIDESVGKKAIRRILKLGADENDEAVTKSVRGMSSKQRRGLMSMMVEADPEAADNLAAQVWRNVLEEGGKPQNAAPFGAQLASAGISPRKLQGAIGKHAELLADVTAHKPEAKFKIRTLLEGLDRMAPLGVQGSDTYLKLAASGLLNNVKGSGGDIAALVSKAADVIQKRALRPEVLYGLISNPESLDDLYKVVRASQTKSLSGAVTREASESLARLAALSARYELQDDEVTDEPAPTPARRGSF